MLSQPPAPLAAWLIEACAARNLSWAEASRQAGLSQGAISAIVRGAQPGLASCKGLAAGFGVPLEDVLEMAGHLTPASPAAHAPELNALAQEVTRLPRPVQQAVLRAWRAVLEGIQAERQPPSG